jgi:group I intron endonuclease
MTHDKSGIYLIRCEKSGKEYVGSSRAVRSRWQAHRSLLNKGKSPCAHLQRAWSKYGADQFSFLILEECGKDVLEAREQFYIDKLEPAMNCLTDVKRRYGAEMLAKRAASLRARALTITNCPRGHAYDEANTYRSSAGKRICRECNRLRVKKVYENETPEQRERRRASAKADYENNYDARRAQQNAYAAAHREGSRAYYQLHREEKREYDRIRRAEAARRRRELRLGESTGGLLHSADQRME